MNIKKYPLGQLQANCYLLVQDKNCILIDPADDANFLLEEISRQRLSLVAMFATHGHFDHVMAVGEIQLSLKIPFYIHEKDLFLIKRLNETAKHFLGYEPHVIEPKIINNLKEGDLKIENLPAGRQGWKLKIIYSPGHTPGGVCFYFPEEQAVFTGDTIFKEAVGRTDLSYSSKKDLSDSINQLIESLPKETIIYPGHGPETTIQQEAPLYHF